MLIMRIIPPAATGYLHLPLAVCAVMRAAAMFNSDMLMIKHSDKLIPFIAFVLYCVSLAALTRFYARQELKNSRLRELISCGAAFIVSGAYVFSKLLVSVSGGEKAAYFGKMELDIVTAVLITGAYLAVVCLTPQKKELVPIAPDEE